MTRFESELNPRLREADHDYAPRKPLPCLIGIGFTSAFVGPIVAGPWLGLATQPAYRELTQASVSAHTQGDSGA
ncbi:MAG: hypothetical protein RI906_207 [Pseudomonadota bacterium]